MSLQFTYVRCFACMQGQVAKLACRTHIALLLVFIAQQYHGNESSRVHFKLR